MEFRSGVKIQDLQVNPSGIKLGYNPSL